ncbi:ubiquitin-specific protease otu1 [Haplosporangium sp. Z 27]|nr:ubiquitin-specific protease otu1 [Haplosporangium sp. Z 27]
MRLRIRHKEGIATLNTLDSKSTLLDLHNEIAKEINVPVVKLESSKFGLCKLFPVKFGYPPKLLVIDETTSNSSLENLGIKDGEQILTSERPDGSTSTFNFSTNQSTLAPSITASTSKSPEPILKPATTSVNAFAPTVGSGSGGFGSRPVVQPSGTLSAFQARASPNNTFGGLSTADTSFKSNPSPVVQPPKISSSSTDAVRVRDQGLLVVREVEDDNSCLFNAIAYTLDPTMKKNIQGLRQIVAQSIEDNPEEYSDAVLGRPRKEYCDWIKRENKLAIFSKHYNIEIDSIDVSTSRVDRFGEGQYSQRALVMYSGIHYDALAITPGLDIPSECDQTQFDADSEDIINAGIQLSVLLKKAHKYTDLATFTLRCSICRAGLKGEKDAQQHAQQTGHTSFEEYQ